MSEVRGGTGGGEGEAELRGGCYAPPSLRKCFEVHYDITMSVAICNTFYSM